MRGKKKYEKNQQPFPDRRHFNTNAFTVLQHSFIYSGIFRLLYFLGVIPWYSLNLRMK